jgi:hypothetical protein
MRSAPSDAQKPEANGEHGDHGDGNFDSAPALRRIPGSRSVGRVRVSLAFAPTSADGEGVRGFALPVDEPVCLVQ